MKPAIFFEHIHRWHFPFIWLYASMLGWRVMCKNIGPSAEGSQWLKRLETEGKLERAAFKRPLYVGQEPSTDTALLFVEKFADAIFARNRHVAAMRRLFGSDDIELAYRQALIERLSRYFYALQMVDRLRDDTRGQIAFVPRTLDAALSCAMGQQLLRALAPQLIVPEEIRMPFWLNAAAAGIALKNRFFGLAALFYLLLTSFPRGLFADARQARRQFDLAVAIVSPRREFTDSSRSLGFLLRGHLLAGARAVFVPLSPLTPAQRQFVRDRGYVLADDGAMLYGDWWKLLMAAASAHPWLEDWVLLATARLARAYVFSVGLLHQYKFSAFVTYADFSIAHFGRNILLRQAGITTWYYTDSANMGNWTTTSLDAQSLTHPYWCYLYYDHFAIWNERLLRYMRAHRQRVGQYHVVGCLWAEHLAQLREAGPRSAYWNALRSAGYRDGHRLVVVFDSWFDPDGLNTADDLVQFADDLTRWLDERDDVFMVLKEKNPPAQMARMFGSQVCSRIYAAHQRLANHPRGCVFGDTHNTSELAAIAEAVVSFPFTSVTYEALCAGIKSVYYDPAGKFRETYYDQFPGLVLHGYGELRNGLNKLLEQSSHEFLGPVARSEPSPRDLCLRKDAISQFQGLLKGALDGNAESFRAFVTK